jgi:hypothetical protein
MGISDLATKAVTALSVLLVLWYFVGRQLNQRRGEELIRWIQKGLPMPAERASVRWIDRSGFQIQVAKVGKVVKKGARSPFRRLELTVLLQPREILLLWGFNVLRGRADSLVFKGTLRTSPQGEVEVVKKGELLARRVLMGLNEEGWTRHEAVGGLVMAWRGKRGPQQVNAISHLVEGLSPRLMRLSLSKKAPHMLVSLSLAGLDERSALSMLSSLWALAQVVTSSGR